LQGDNASLEYIVKTQKLENITGPELTSKIEIEDYNPGENRKQEAAAAAAEKEGGDAPPGKSEES
jgi:hypothetical protein